MKFSGRLKSHSKSNLKILMMEAPFRSLEIKEIPKCCYMLTYISYKTHKYHRIPHRILQIYDLLKKRLFLFLIFLYTDYPPLLFFQWNFQFLHPTEIS